MEINSQTTRARRFLAFILGRSGPRPARAKVYVPQFFTVRIEIDATAYLREQLDVNISQKARGLYRGTFKLAQLEEFLDLLPPVEGWVLMNDAQRKLLEEYVYTYWDLARDSEDFGRASAYDAFLDGLHFANPKKSVAV